MTKVLNIKKAYGGLQLAFGQWACRAKYHIVCLGWVVFKDFLSVELSSLGLSLLGLSSSGLSSSGLYLSGLYLSGLYLSGLFLSGLYLRGLILWYVLAMNVDHINN